MKHAPPTNPRRSSRIIWNSASKNTSGTYPSAPINLEEEENAHVQETEQVKVPEKGGSNSTTQKSPAKKLPVKKSVIKKKNVVDEPPSGSQPVGTKKRKKPDMSNWNKKAIVSGTTYVPEEIEACGWNIIPFLSYQKWEKVVSLDDLVYREAVKEFYANAKYTLEPLQITSWIGDREFTISPLSIGQALAIPSEGVQIFEENRYNSIGISGKELKNILLKDPSSSITAPNFKPIVRILHHISSHTLLPRAGSFEKVTTGDQIILYHLMEKKSLSLPFLIIHHMISAIKADKLQNSLHYGKALTKIFNHYLIKLFVKDGSIESKPFTSKNLKIMGLSVTSKDEQDGGKKKKQKVSHSSTMDDDETLTEALRRETRSKKKYEPKPKKSAEKSEGNQRNLSEKVQVEKEGAEKELSKEEDSKKGV